MPGPETSTSRRAEAAAVLAVLAGGVLGTTLRLSIDALLPHGGVVFPLGPFLINVAGSFALGLLVGRIWPVAPAWLRAGLGAGLLGSFTTFSALAVSAVDLTVSGQGASAVLYVVASVVGGISAAATGLRLGTRGRPAPPTPPPTPAPAPAPTPAPLGADE